MKMVVRPCPICGGRDVEVIHHQEFILPAGYPLPSSYDVVFCSWCNFAYADTTATQVDYDRYYAEFSKYQDNTTTGGGATPADQMRLETTAQIIAEAIPNRQSRILELGCANGGLLGELKKLDYKKLFGVDPSPTCAKRVEQKFNVETAVATVHSLPKLGSFDMIILSHVLEHVLDLNQVMTVLHQVTAPGGLIYLEVPDASRYADFIVAPFQDFNTEHINHFCLSSLSALASKHGFHPIKSAVKDIKDQAGWFYPAFFTIYQLSGPQSEEMCLAQGRDFKGALMRYIERSKAMFSQLESRIKIHTNTSTPVIIWGAGQLTFKLLALTSLQHANIIAFVDSNAINQGRQLFGHPIVAPSQIQSSTTPIIIATLLHNSAILRQIRDGLRLANPVITLEVN